MSGAPARTAVSSLRFTEFFEGDASAWGVFIDRFGIVRQHLTVQLHGAWHGSLFHLDEVFAYGTGERETRQWVVQDGDGGSFRATCPDCVGPIVGEAGADGLRLTYDYLMPLAGRRVVMSFDDRMYRLTDTRVFNRAAMKKFGITLGYVTLFIEKQVSKPQGAAR